MEFYAQCTRLRNDYLKREPASFIQLTLLSKLVAFAFFNPIKADILPIGYPISIDCTDILSANLQEIKRDLGEILEDLNFVSYYIDIKHFYSAHSIYITLR